MFFLHYIHYKEVSRYKYLIKLKKNYVKIYYVYKKWNTLKIKT